MLPLPNLPQRVSAPGPIIDYLNQMSQMDPKMKAMAQDAADAVKRVLATDDGAMLLELLMKSIHDFTLPPSADARALDALNAQRFIPLDLIRIASDEYETVHQQLRSTSVRPGRRRRSNAGSAG